MKQPTTSQQIAFSHELPSSLKLIRKSNYSGWAKHILMILAYFDDLDVYVLDSNMPKYSNESHRFECLSRSKIIDEWVDKNLKVTLVTATNVSNEVRELLCDCDSAPAMWKVLEERYGKKEK